MSGGRQVAIIFDVGVKRAHPRRAVLEHAQGPCGALGGLPQKAGAEFGRLGQARAGLTLAA